MPKIYNPVHSSLDLVNIENSILAYWDNKNTFTTSLRGENEFIFYDGPPFANGLPHYGHLLTGFIKDAFARYQTMLGNKVNRRFGWDCHGLPAEMAAEKELKISGKKEIEGYGIDKFNEHCKSSVLTYTREWKSYVNRQARWVDFANDYKTMDLSYMESVLWAFKELHNKGLIYQDMRVMPYSWACETPVSDFETRIDNAYREKKSKAVTVAFELTDATSDLAGAKLLVWTTTPWTLPSNLAIAVGKDIEYSCVRHENNVYIIATQLLPKLEQEIGDNVITQVKGSQLIGLAYKPLFDYFAGHKNAFRVLHADFVTTEDGTGIVHIAPGFGEEDQQLCNAHNIELVCPVDGAGKFTSEIPDYQGMQVFETNDSIIIALKAQKSWIKTEQYLHNYPHCWRTDTPLIYKALPSWYVRVTAIKYKMVANNQKINWIPGHIKDGLFGKWLENARDWSISRNRYWGCPIPVWQSDDPSYPCTEVYGSIKEIEAAFNVKVTDLHRPHIDKLTKPNPNDPTGKSKLVRVPEVLDCWFESGSMPYAQVHYPFENTEWFKSHFPADFIVEYVAQTRGWFYTLMVLSTALFDRPPFLNCICHGVILGEGGNKLSKRLKNYADPQDVFKQYGTDAMRWYMLSSPVMRGQELVIDRKATGIQATIRHSIKPIWNAYNFFVLYANADGVQGEFALDVGNVMDIYIISKCLLSVRQIKNSLDHYNTIEATKIVEEFFETLNNWYIRRNRERFWRSEKDQDKTEAYNTLYTVLVLMCKAAAPLLPLILEEIYLNISKSDSSLHLELFPSVEEKYINYDLIKEMEKVREACNAALHVRNEVGIRVRQPLQKVVFIGVSEQVFSDKLSNLVLDEINVKEWVNLSKSDILTYADYRLELNFPVLAKRLSHKMKKLIAGNKQNDWKLVKGTVYIAGEQLEPQEYNLKLSPKQEYQGKISALPSNDSLVFLDTNINDSLYKEGLARDIVRSIQQMRKEAGFNITQTIRLMIESQVETIQEAIKEWEQYIKEQTLAHSLEFKIEGELFTQAVTVEEFSLQIGIAS